MHVESSSKYLEVGARVELTLVSGTYRCLTFIVSVAVHDEAACGIHVARLTIILCTGLPQYCKQVLKKMGVAWRPRFRGQTDQGPVFRSMICLASVWGSLSDPHSVNVSAARAYSAPVFLIYIWLCLCPSRDEAARAVRSRLDAVHILLHRCSKPRVCRVVRVLRQLCVTWLAGSELDLLVFLLPFVNLAHGGSAHGDCVSLPGYSPLRMVRPPVLEQG